MYLGLCDELATIHEISAAYDISRNHLMKVVQKLAKAGYIESVRGQGGGLRLKTRPEDIRIGDVVRNMEPDVALVECQRSDNQCVISPACRLKRVFERAQLTFLDQLDETTLRDLLPRPARKELIRILDIEN